MEFTTRGQIALFLVVTFFLSYLIEAYILTAVGTVYSPVTALLMWVPGLVGIFCSWFFGYQFQDLGLRATIGKYFVIAYAVPAGAVLIMLAVAFAAGLGHVETYSLRGLLRLFLTSPTLGVFLALFSVAGAELGWRGFLQSRMQDIQVPFPHLMVGLMWAAWYWPLIVFGDYAPTHLPWLTLFSFTVMLISLAVFLGWLRQTSRSLWPAILAHATHVVWVQTVFPGFFKGGPLSVYLTGEAGFILATLYLIVAILLLREEEEARALAADQ